MTLAEIRLHSFFGPLEGQLDASPLESDMKSRRGPPHCVHDAVVWPSVVAGAIASAANRESRAS